MSFNNTILFTALIVGVASISNPVNAKIIADYEAQFSASSPATGWTYKWNPTGVEIGHSNGYIDLVEPGGNWRLVVDKNNPPGTNGPTDAKWLKLQTDGMWTPGESSKRASDALDHYVIAAYQIQQGEAGRGAIKASHLQRSSEWGSGEIRIYVNSTLITSVITAEKDAACFDVSLGPLNTGDIIYVAYGPNHSGSTGAQIQFKIDVAP